MNKRVLITGFEPFDGENANPSGDWIAWMNGRKKPLKRDILGLILPVTFTSAFDYFKKSYDEFCPDIVVLTGLAKNRKELTVERIGINWIDARIPDNDGVMIKAQKINNEGPDGIFTNIDMDKLISLAGRSGCNLKISSSAGEYVCNDILYKVLSYSKDKNTLTTFIHLPGIDNYDGIYHVLESIVNEIS